MIEEHPLEYRAADWPTSRLRIMVKKQNRRKGNHRLAQAGGARSPLMLGRR